MWHTHPHTSRHMHAPHRRIYTHSYTQDPHPQTPTDTHTQTHGYTYALIHNFAVTLGTHMLLTHTDLHVCEPEEVMCFLRLPNALGVRFKLLGLAFGTCHMEFQTDFSSSFFSHTFLSTTSTRTPVSGSLDDACWQGGCEVEAWYSGVEAFHRWHLPEGSLRNKPLLGLFSLRSNVLSALILPDLLVEAWPFKTQTMVLFCVSFPNSFI